MFTLPPLPYELNALAPVCSAETLEYHYHKHHQAYIDKLNALLASDTTHSEGTSQGTLESLKELVKTAPAGALFNNAAQALNHQLFWQQFQAPKEQNKPEGALEQAIIQQRESFEAFQAAFETSALNNFGSGRTRLVKTPSGTLEIVNTSNAGNPLTDGKIPLLTVDVWEHAYYIDYRNRRADYLKNFWKIIHWEYIATL